MADTILQQSQANLNGYFLQKQIEVLIDMNNKKIATEFSKLNSAISRLNEEISEIKKNIREGTQIQKEQCAPFSEKTNVNLNSDSCSSKDQLLRQKCGEFKSEDVAVSKFFYFGNKPSR